VDFKAVIELVKYTLALSAACFAYALDKLVPAPTLCAKWFVLSVLILFLIAALAGIVIFSSATAALHGDAARSKRQEKFIQPLAYIHILALIAGVLLLGGNLIGRVFTDAPPSAVAQDHR
jgi:ABC-type multidrug transport system fused ATPase/permease subunit